MAATKTKKAAGAGLGSAGNNDGSRRQKTRDQERCQWCHTKVPLTDQFVVYNDIPNQKVIKAKDATKPKHVKKSHYCSDCADKRKATKEKFDEAVNRGKGAVKKAAKKGKAAVKKKVAAKPKSTESAPKKRRVVKRKAKAAEAKASAEPF
jgi:hypothetical protein